MDTIDIPLPLVKQQRIKETRNAPEFPGFACLAFAIIVGGPIHVMSGDSVVVRVNGHGDPVVMRESFPRNMLIKYIGIYEILEQGGIASMFFERDKNGN